MNLDDLNMKYVAKQDFNEEIDGGAILECARSWTNEQLRDWLPQYDSDMIDSVQGWLNNESEIAEGQYLKVWVD